MQQKQNILIELKNGFANCTVNMLTGEVTCTRAIAESEQFAGNGTLWAELCEEEQIRLDYFRKGQMIYIAPAGLEMLLSLCEEKIAA